MSSQLKVFDTLNNLPNSVKILGGLAFCTGASIVLHGKIRDIRETRRLDKARKQRQADRAEASAKLHLQFPFTPELREISELSLENLMLKLQSRELSASKVLAAFIAKSLQVTDEFNCITEFSPRAVKWAADLDALPEVKGPFHGIPICVKDDTDLVGMDTTVGYSQRLNKPAAESAVLVKMLMDLGAVPICKTNCPQTCNSYGSENPIYGTTLNALNKNLSPGGSSSGTGCLVAAGGVPFGTGGDTGGSLRIPAHFNGIATLKPSTARLSRKGLQQCVRRCIGLTSVGFVLAKYPSDVALIFKAITENNRHCRYDPKVVPIPWNEALFSSTKPLRIGYYGSFGSYPCLGDTRETVMKAKRAFESFGHTLFEIQIPKTRKAYNLESELCNADMGKHLLEDLKHDKISPLIANLYDAAATPVWKRRLLTSIPVLRDFYAHLKPGLATRSSSDLWDAMADRDALITQFLELFEDLHLDLILGPAFPFPAVGIEDFGAFGSGEVSFTSLWNVIDFPAGIVRFGTESGKYEAASRRLAHIYKINKMTIKNAIGMPIGVQLSSKPFHEEVVLRGMVLLDQYYQAKIRMEPS